MTRRLGPEPVKLSVKPQFRFEVYECYYRAEKQRDLKSDQTARERVSRGF